MSQLTYKEVGAVSRIGSREGPYGVLPRHDSADPALPLRPLATTIGLAMFLIVLLLGLLGACSRGQAAQETRPADLYRPAMRFEFEGDLADLARWPHYALEVSLAPDLSVLTGTARIDVPNSSQDPWNELVFRLYPMLDQYGGNMTIRRVALDGQPANFVYLADNTAIQVNLYRPLLPEEVIQVDLSWRLEIPTWTDAPSIYALFGTSQGMTSLPLFYPSLAVYQPGPVPGIGEWWLELGTVRGDAGFNYTSLFWVTATLPANHVPVASGTLISSTLIDSGRARHVWVTGPTREFLLHTSPFFQSVITETLGTRVASFWLPGQEAAGRAALEHAVAALRIYSDLFGPYPYRDLRVAPAPLSFRGMEYPQVSLLGTELYGQYKANLEILVAHEIAHQWWYQIVHNDPVRTPWLDESLAEYASKLYMEALRGEDDAAELQWKRWEIPLSQLRNRDQDAPVNRPVDSFANGSQYETIVYGKGALFYAAMHETLGTRRFRQFMRGFLDEHRFGVVDTGDWLEAVRDLGNPILLDLYSDWIRGRSPQRAARPEPTPTELTP